MRLSLTSQNVHANHLEKKVPFLGHSYASTLAGAMAQLGSSRFTDAKKQALALLRDVLNLERRRVSRPSHRVIVTLNQVVLLL